MAKKKVVAHHTVFRKFCLASTGDYTRAIKTFNKEVNEYIQKGYQPSSDIVVNKISANYQMMHMSLCLYEEDQFKNMTIV